MMKQTDMLSRSAILSTKIALVLHKRLQLAQEHFLQRVRAVIDARGKDFDPQQLTPWSLWQSHADYAVDVFERCILFWEILHQRGNNYVAHERAGKPPLLHFAYETVLDGRSFERPVNYALLRIKPPAGVVTGPTRRPYVIIDPRAGHGPGIGGFKDDSQVGVALRDGHPVYFVVFFPEPEPGQTMLDVCAAERVFVRRVHELHPDSPKPVIVGNCQGGWAAMMLAASSAEDSGPIVINGAPMSYWGGAWSEGEGDNPMRYSGGLLGGTWLASLLADMGNGRFDGAWLVQNFENLNPANTFWDKYYHLFANADTEAPRFLEFERWWGGYFLMNREEIEWITQNLFVGNRLWSGAVGLGEGRVVDLRAIRSPIILFASMGDNITPPQQAFNWVADVYGSTEEIKANGQVIVGLLHEDVGHLGIFVSGRVAKKEHAQIVSVLKSIEALPAGLYGMRITEDKDENGRTAYNVHFIEHRLEEIAERLNRFKRADEKPFEAVTVIAEFNQKAYELFLRPFVEAATSDFSAEVQRVFHPLRTQRWALSDLNPAMAWLGPMAATVKATRHALDASAAPRRDERAMSSLYSAALDYYREVRDAMSETMFFQIFGSSPFSLYLAERQETLKGARPGVVEALELPVVKDALAAMESGGYAESLARIGALLARVGTPIPLERLHTWQDLFNDYQELLPDIAPDERRRIRGEQDIIVRYEPERALETLPVLVAEPAERQRLLSFIERLLQDPRLLNLEPTQEQAAMVERIKTVLGPGTWGARRAPRKKRADTG